MDVAKLGLFGNDESQTDKSKRRASVLACAKRFPRNPPLSQQAPNVRPFQSQSGQIFVSSSLPMHLTLTRLIALCAGQTCYPLVQYRCQKRSSPNFLSMSFNKRKRRITRFTLLDKGLTNPHPPPCKITQGVNLAIKSQLWALLTCKFFSLCFSATGLHRVRPKL